MTRSPSSRRHRQRLSLSPTMIRALLALAVFALFSAVCLMAIVAADGARAAQVLIVVAPLLTIVLNFYFRRRRE